MCVPRCPGSLQTEDTPFGCLIDGCEYVGANGYEAKDHMETVHRPTMHCTETVNGKETSYAPPRPAYYLVSASHHQRRRYYRCLFAPCRNKVAQSRFADLSVHHNDHLGIRPFRCPCYEVVTDPETGEYTRVRCGTRTCKPVALRRHCMYEHNLINRGELGAAFRRQAEIEKQLQAENAGADR